MVPAASTTSPATPAHPPAAGDPFAYYTAHDDTHQVVYRGSDGHLWELYWPGVAPVVGWDLTALSGAPAATGTPAAYYSAGTNTKHVIYRSADGRLHEIWWVPGGGTPAHVDLTAAYGAPAGRGPARGVHGRGTQHAARAYRGTDNHIYEVVWPVAVTVPPPVVTISPEPLITPEDVAQFDARWMGAEDLAQRLSEYKLALTHRQAWIAWGVFDDAAAMARMFELTRDHRVPGSLAGHQLCSRSSSATTGILGTDIPRRTTPSA